MVLSMAFLLAVQGVPKTAAAEQPFVVYEVKAGDTVRNVAARHGIDPLNLTAANGLAEADALPPAGTILLIPKSPKDVLGTLYEAKRRGLGAWPKPRLADEFLSPLVPPDADAGTQKPDALPPEKTPPAKTIGGGAPKPAGGRETLRPDEAAATAPAVNDATDVPAKQPVVKATTHLVREGDTLYRIARTYGVSFSELLRVKGFKDTSVIRIGQTIRLPEEADPAHLPAKTASGTAKPKPAAAEGPSQRKMIPRISLVWPLRSGQAPKQVGTNFGSGLSASATPGEPVYAAADGTVLHGGWMKDFGNAAYVNHGNGIATFYGGLGTLYVKSGQAVKQGTKIAVIGDGAKPRLVFHLLKDGKSVDPREFLAKP